MKITDNYAIGSAADVPLRTALTQALDGSSHGDGRLEALSGDIDVLKELLIELVEALVENGKLTDRNIEALLGGRFKVSF